MPQCDEFGGPKSIQKAEGEGDFEISKKCVLTEGVRENVPGALGFSCRGLHNPNEDASSAADLAQNHGNTTGQTPIASLRAVLPCENVHRAVARANFLALDRLDIQFAVKEICRAMSSPTEWDKRKIKKGNKIPTWATKAYI